MLIIAALVALVVTGAATAIVLTVSATNAAAEKAAAAAAAAKSDQEEAARLASAQDEAAGRLEQGEIRYSISRAYAEEDARAALREALDDLATTQHGKPASADQLESATEAVAKAMAAVGQPPSPVNLLCGNTGTGVDFAVHTIVLRPDGSGEYADLWAAQLRCDTGMTGGSVTETVSVQTPLQKAAVAAAKAAGYSDYHRTDAEVLYALYDGCGESGPGSYYSDATALSEAQAKEVRAYLTLCPDHPDAANWRAATGAGEEVRAAEANGTRIPPGGSFLVPSQMVMGMFVAENVEGCYWETRDSNGNIIDNSFVIAAPRVVAEVGSDAVVFNTEGGCGYWNYAG